MQLFAKSFVLSVCSLGFAHGAQSGRATVVNTWGFTNATEKAWEVLLMRSETPGLDAVEQGCMVCERDRCDGSVGWGGSPNENGETTLDGMIMDGSTFAVGSVGCLRRVRDVISVARKVMENTFHTLLVGEDATTFAVQHGFKEECLASVESSKLWADWMAAGRVPNFRKNTTVDAFEDHDIVGHDTIGMVVVQPDGKVTCGTSTNGASHKVPGRVGDSPIAGAGAYCDSSVGGAAGTGDGDVMMRFLPSFSAVHWMRQGMSPTKACELAMEPISKAYPNAQGGLVCVNNQGEHGAAKIGLKEFPYSVRNAQMPEVEVITV